MSVQKAKEEDKEKSTQKEVRGLRGRAEKKRRAG